MPISAPATSARPSAVSVRSTRDSRAYYAQRLQTAQENITRLEIRLGQHGQRSNPDLSQVWQKEIVYWRQAERDATVMLAQQDGRAIYRIGAPPA